jgi:hypothetical protein
VNTYRGEGAGHWTPPKSAGVDRGALLLGGVKLGFRAIKSEGCSVHTIVP